MDNDTKKTVNLRKGLNQSRFTGEKRYVGHANSKFDQIDKVYQEDEIQGNNEIQRIQRPQKQIINETVLRKLIWIILFIVLIFLAYILFLKPDNAEVAEKKSEIWYQLKLVNGEIYYGQIENISSDPIVVNKVYYNYDQQKEGTETIGGSGSLRLVKKGKETYGPNGSMNIVRNQVLYMEELKSESKVLQAILEYEK